jgi:hypothetical protein
MVNNISLSTLGLVMLGILSGMIICLLGIESLEENLNGWLLFADGMLFGFGGSYSLAFGRRFSRFEVFRNNLRLWLLVPGILAVMIISPLEYLLLTAVFPRSSEIQVWGGTLSLVGTTILLAALFPLPAFTKFREINFCLRCCLGYIGALLAITGIALGFSSLIGFLAVIAIFLPALIWWLRATRY